MKKRDYRHEKALEKARGVKRYVVKLLPPEQERLNTILENNSWTFARWVKEGLK